MNREDKDSEKKQGERQDEEDQKEEEKNQIRYANWTSTFSPFSIRSSDDQFWSISVSQWVDTKLEVTQSANHLKGHDAISTCWCQDTDEEKNPWPAGSKRCSAGVEMRKPDKSQSMSERWNHRGWKL